MHVINFPRVLATSNRRKWNHIPYYCRPSKLKTTRIWLHNEVTSPRHLASCYRLTASWHPPVLSSGPPQGRVRGCPLPDWQGARPHGQQIERTPYPFCIFHPKVLLKSDFHLLCFNWCKLLCHWWLGPRKDTIAHLILAVRDKVGGPRVQVGCNMETYLKSVTTLSCDLQIV
jgi:hypothetical protein